MIIDRASSFSDPAIIETLKTRCINVAIDQWYTRRQKDAEGDFYRKIAGQSPQNNFNTTTQGLYLAAPDGTLLGFTNHRSPERVKAVLERGLAAYSPSEASALKVAAPDRNFSPEPPAGGLVLTVTAKVLEGHEATSDPALKMFQESTGRDMLWLRKDEHEALARGELTASVKSRLARYTLLDFTRGEPAFWDPADVRSFDLQFKDGILTGSVHLEDGTGKTGFRPALRGVVEVKDGKVVRFDLVARGTAWGHRGVTATAAPKGKFTLAVAYRLPAGGDEADRVLPQGVKAWLPDYLR